MSKPAKTGGQPIIYTERMILRLADPYDDADSQLVVSMYSDPNGGKGGNNKVGINTIADVARKMKWEGPKAKYCTRAPPPNGQYFLMFLPAPGSKPSDNNEGAFMGMMTMSFRPEMPYPDIGYAVKLDYQGRRYASEAARAVLDWWRDVIGVREVWVGSLPDNVRSQRLSKSIGFVPAGTFDIVFGDPPDEAARIKDAPALVLPGMTWKQGQTIYPSLHG